MRFMDRGQKITFQFQTLKLALKKAQLRTGLRQANSKPCKVNRSTWTICQKGTKMKWCPLWRNLTLTKQRKWKYHAWTFWNNRRVQDRLIVLKFQDSRSNKKRLWSEHSLVHNYNIMEMKKIMWVTTTQFSGLANNNLFFSRKIKIRSALLEPKELIKRIKTQMTWTSSNILAEWVTWTCIGLKSMWTRCQIESMIMSGSTIKATL